MNHLEFYSLRLQQDQLGADWGLKSVTDIIDTSVAKAEQRFSNIDKQSAGMITSATRLETLGKKIGKTAGITAGLALTYVAWVFLRPLPRRGQHG